MAGASGRFAGAGYDLPKYMLEARGRSLFAHAVSSFSNQFGRQMILLVCRDVAGTRTFLDAELAMLGVGESDVEICVLDAPTSGQAETVARALRWSGVDGAEPLTVFNIDTFRPGFGYPPALDLSRIDGYLEVFRGEGAHWSFVRPEDPAADDGRAIEVTEKVRVSDLCSTGLYFFRSVDFFLSLYAEVENADPGGLPGGERYVAPLYEIALKRGADIRYHVVGRDEVVFCGTPAEYDAFRMAPETGAKIAFCVSGQIRGPKSMLRDIAELAEKVGADVFLSVWEERGRKTFSGATGSYQLSRLMGVVPALMLPHAFYNRMHDIFPDIDRRLAAITEDVRDELAEIFPDAVTDIEAPIPDLDLETEGNDTNSLRMLYKIWRCNRLKRDTEAARGQRYETVARFRPDVLPDVEAYRRMDVGPNHAAFPGRDHAGGRLSDVLWICDSPTDDYLSSLFGTAAQAPQRRWRTIHRELHAHAVAGGLQISHLALKKGLSPDASEEDQAMVRDLVAAALVQNTCTLPEGFSADSAEPLGRLMQAQAMPADRPDAFEAIVEISQASDDITIIRAALQAAVDRRPDAPAADLYSCILAAGVLASIEWNETERSSFRGPDLNKFLKTWKKQLSAVDDMPPAPDPDAGAGVTGGALLQMADHAYDIGRRRIGQDALSQTLARLVADVNADPSILVQRLRRLLKSGRVTEGLVLADAAADHLPDDSRLFIMLSGCRARAGDANGALADMRRAVDSDPSNWRLWARLGKLELAAGRMRSAAVALRNSARLATPKSAHDLLASIKR
jgi:hypothetical protein